MMSAIILTPPIVAAGTGLLVGGFVAGVAAGRRSSKGSSPRAQENGQDGDAAGSGRAVLDRELRRCYAEWNRREKTFCVLVVMFDANEQHHCDGQAASSAHLLRPVVNALGVALRELDCVAEMADMSVAAVLPSTDKYEAALVAFRLQHVLALRAAWRGETEGFPQCGMGLASIRTEDSATTLLERASDAARLALEGDDRTICWHDGEQGRPVEGLVGDAAEIRLAQRQPVA